MLQGVMNAVSFFLFHGETWQGTICSRVAGNLIQQVASTNFSFFFVAFLNEEREQDCAW